MREREREGERERGGGRERGREREREGERGREGGRERGEGGREKEKGREREVHVSFNSAIFIIFACNFYFFTRISPPLSLSLSLLQLLQ